MAKKKRLLPFHWLPSSWGLSGQTRARAEAEYYFDGKDLEYEIMCIEFPDEDSEERMKKELAFMKKWNDITEAEYNKELANLEDREYFDVLDSKYVVGKDGTGQFMFELDWNAKFVLNLKANGWPGLSPEEIVDNWFSDVCKQMSSEFMSGDMPSPTLYPQRGMHSVRKPFDESYN